MTAAYGPPAHHAGRVGRVRGLKLLTAGVSAVA